MPVGSSLRISSSVVVHGRTEEKTCCSRTARAMSCVYWPPKSRTTTPPRSELGRSWCCCIWTPLDIVPPFLGSQKQHKKSKNHDATGYGSACFNLNPQGHQPRAPRGAGDLWS